MKMDKRIKKRWIKALRSGEYKRATGQLKETNVCKNGKINEYYCCLGVLCDLYSKSKEGKGIEFEDNRFCGERSHLPSEVIDWADIQYEEDGNWDCLEDPLISKSRTAADYNDSGYSFKKIADLIEKNL